MKAAWRAMCAHANLDPDSLATRRTLNIGGYLDDHKATARVGVDVFIAECTRVG